MNGIPLEDYWPEDGPEVDVWNHVQTGIDLADDELGNLAPELRHFTEAVANALLLNRTKIVLDAKEKSWAELDQDLLLLPWVRYAADLAIAIEGVGRATRGLERYIDLQPAVATQPIPNGAERYIREVVHTYIFGFDAACIALCRAALEEILKRCLVSAGVYTAPQLRREDPTAGTLLEKAKQNGLLPKAYDSAKHVVTRGNQLMHGRLPEERILKQSAADSVRHFTCAAVDLLGGPPTFG